MYVYTSDTHKLKTDAPRTYTNERPAKAHAVPPVDMRRGSAQPRRAAPPTPQHRRIPRRDEIIIIDDNEEDNDNVRRGNAVGNNRHGPKPVSN